NAVSSTMTIVAAASTPCAMTTGTGNLRSGGTRRSLITPRAPAGTRAAVGALYARYTPTQRPAIVRPSTATTTRIRIAVQASPDAPPFRYADHTTRPPTASRACALITVLGRWLCTSDLSYSM